jgi:hypothetical protein
VAGPRQEAFQKLVAQLFREREKHPQLTVTLLRQHWRAILGEELAGKTYPARISRDTLWINAVDASWAYQLQFMKAEILESIHVFTESAAIKALRFRQGEVRWPDEPGAEGAAPAESLHPEGEAPAESLQAEGADEPAPAAGEGAADEPPGADTIADPSLRRSFSRWRSGLKRKKARQGVPPGS